MADPLDPLGVLSTTRRVVERARFVRIDADAVAQTAAALVDQQVAPPDWSHELHWSDGREALANYILVLDATNFCFWGEPRWRVAYRGRRYDGYWALAAALKRALERGVPLTDAGYLAAISRDEVASIFAGEGEIPLLDERVAILQETGRVLRDRYAGRFSQAIEQAGRSAVSLVRIIAEDFPSFRDVAYYDGEPVYFYKRAQILVGDLAGAFGGRDLGAFEDLDALTAFADYKVPQVLHHLGMLRYAPELRDRLARRALLPAGSPEEVEIRAATIWGVEALRRALAERGRPLAAYQVDWLLWNAGQSLPADALPYHRTRTIFY
ncbi:MAG: queuosine salvage family protein [Sphaerobacter sp.]|nr:queuosine salvage family protein [Sphaerobacter sp.]